MSGVSLCGLAGIVRALPVPAVLEVARPVYLWALLLVVPLVILHLYRRRRLVVPFLPLLVEAVGPRRSGGGWHRLRELLSLLLRIGVLVAVVLALAGLGPAASAEPPPALWVVVDADRTTRAVEADGRTRYQHALVLARAAVRAQGWAEVTVIEARASVTVLVAATTRLAAAAARLETLLGDVDAGRREPSAVSVNLRPALAEARRQADTRSRARILVLSARALPEGAESDDRIESWGSGRTSEDQGLVAFDVIEDAVGGTLRVLVSVRNDAGAVRSRDLVMRLGDEEVERHPLTLPGGETAEVVFEAPAPRDGAWLQVRLEGEDAFARNDAADAWLAPSEKPSVLVVRDRGAGVRPYTQAILEAMGDAIDVEASGSVAVDDLAKARTRDVVLVDGVALPRGSLRPGAWLFLAPLEGELPFEVGSPLIHPLVWRTAPDHPLVRDLDLAMAYVVRGYPVSGEGTVTLAEADGQAILAEGQRDGIRYVALGLDPEGSDLPLSAALPLLVRNAIQRLAAQPARPLAAFYRPGEVLRPRLPLPHGPDAVLRWGGADTPARLEADGPGWTVPPGARGRVEIVTRDAGEEAWTGRTAFVDVSSQETIRPVRAAHAAPPGRRRAPLEDVRWRRALLSLALLLLLADLAVMVSRGRPSAKLAPVSVRG